MSPIKPSYLLIIMAASLALGGCGDRNSKAVSFSPEGGHPPNWTTVHKTSAKANLGSCAECHGANFDGGIANVACSLCHLGGAEEIHPAEWGDFAYTRHKSYSTAQKTVSCANAACHGAALTGVAGSGPSCATTCHLGGTYKKHPANWTTISSHKNYLDTIPNDSTSCKTAVCHGTDGKGVFLSGPACDQCHPME